MQQYLFLPEVGISKLFHGVAVVEGVGNSGPALVSKVFQDPTGGLLSKGTLDQTACGGFQLAVDIRLFDFIHGAK